MTNMRYGKEAQIEAMSIEHGVHGQCLLCKCFVPHSKGLNSYLLVHIDTIVIVIIKIVILFIIICIIGFTMKAHSVAVSILDFSSYTTLTLKLYF